MFLFASCRRAVVLVALVAAILGSLACSSGNSTSRASTSSSTTSAAGTVIEVKVSGGHVEGGVQRKSIKAGEPVVLRVTSDVADEVHVHGYDKKAQVEAGGTVDVTFTADIPGVFEAELENAHVTLVELEIS